MLFDEDWDSAGAKLDAADTYSGNKATIFNLLKDGGAHTFYFFFWVNQANNAVISQVRLWEATGTCWTVDERPIFSLKFQGLMSISVRVRRVGTGSLSVYLNPGGALHHHYHLETVGESRSQTFVCDNDDLIIKGTVATDLNYIDAMFINLRTLE